MKIAIPIIPEILESVEDFFSIVALASEEEDGILEKTLQGFSMKGKDFSKSQVDSLILSLPDLKGAMFTTYQAAELAKLLGVIVKVT